jgi:hypothetical protein
MQQRISLREWAKENKVWEPKSWRIFLEKDHVPFYKQAFILNDLYKFLYLLSKRKYVDRI